MQEFCALKSDYFLDSRHHSSWHYHASDFSKGAIREQDLHWIPQEILGNPKEMPFYQFSISIAFGRVVGFWHETTFYVVLLDPGHNSWYCEYNDYRRRDTRIAEPLHASLLRRLDEAETEQGRLFSALRDPGERTRSLLYTFVDQDYVDLLANHLAERGGMTLAGLIKEYVEEKCLN